MRKFKEYIKSKSFKEAREKFDEMTASQQYAFADYFGLKRCSYQRRTQKYMRFINNYDDALIVGSLPWGGGIYSFNPGKLKDVWEEYSKDKRNVTPLNNKSLILRRNKISDLEDALSDWKKLIEKKGGKIKYKSKNDYNSSSILNGWKSISIYANFPGKELDHSRNHNHYDLRISDHHIPNGTKWDGDNYKRTGGALYELIVDDLQFPSEKEKKEFNILCNYLKDKSYCKNSD